MTSVIVDPIAEGIKTVLGTISGLKGYKWPSKELDSMPGVVIEIPAWERVATEEAESQLGSEDWNFQFPVVFYFDLGDLNFSQGQAVEVMEAFVTAVDNNQTLGVGTSAVAVNDAKVVRADAPEYLEDAPRPTLRWTAEVHVFALVTT